MSVKVFITGAGGFLGKELARQCLARGYEVVGVARSHYPELEEMGVRMNRADISSPEAYAGLEGCEALFHVAAKAGAWGAYEDYVRSNVSGTERALEAARRCGVRRLIYTSSPSVAHAGGDLEGVSEAEAPYPDHFSAAYPETKARAERLVLSANGAELSTVALRPHLIWGPGDQHLIPRILSRADRGRLRHLAPDKLVDSVYIEDAARAHLNAFDRLGPEASCAGRAYFISQGEPWAMKALMNGILAACGRAPVEKTLSPRVAYTLGSLFELSYRALGIQSEPPMTRFIAEQLSTAHWYDISAARRELGYEPARSISEALELLAEACAQGGAEVRAGS